MVVFVFQFSVEFLIRITPDPNLVGKNKAKHVKIRKDFLRKYLRVCAYLLNTVLLEMWQRIYYFYLN
jgi:hypothetical protein